ncbi:MAG: NADH-quinone oxidoreductase subunit N [Vulcanimicrobiota bacterium]
MILSLPSLADFQTIVPELVLGALVVMALLLELGGQEEQAEPPIARLAPLALLGLIGWLFTRPGRESFLGFNLMVVDDGISRALALVVSLALLLTFTVGVGELDYHRVGFRGEFFALLLSAGLGMVLMGAANNLIVIFLGLELFSLSLYLLCVFFPHEPASQESGLKYFILSSAASAVMLYGMALIYGATGSTWLGEIMASLEHEPGLLVRAGMMLVLAGLAFKVSAVPLHNWTPDVYEGAPTSVTAFMSVATKAAALTVLIRIFAHQKGEFSPVWMAMVGGLVVTSVLTGNLMALAQTRVKRMLAYSGIGHAGYLLMAITAQGSADGALYFYLVVYAFMNVGAFLAVLCLEQALQTEVTIESCRGLASRNPLWAWSFALCLVALAGLPPTGGFLAKYFLFSAVLEAGQAALPAIGLIGSFIGAAYYLGLVLKIFSSSDEEEQQPPLEMPSGALLGLALCAFGALALGLAPGPLFGWIGL